MYRLRQIAKEVHQNAKNKGWYDESKTEDQIIESLCNNIHNEVSELHEAWRNNIIHEPCDKAEGMKTLGLNPLTCLEEELADIIIRALDNAEYLNVDIENAIRVKHVYNVHRDKRHGGKRS